MGQKVEEIKKQLSAALESQDTNKVMRLCALYDEDERSGVKAAVRMCRKRLEALEKERKRLDVMWSYERKYEHLGPVCGIDEAGRGPLAGPVVAAAVILDINDPILCNLNIFYI